MIVHPAVVRQMIRDLDRRAALADPGHAVGFRHVHGGGGFTPAAAAPNGDAGDREQRDEGQVLRHHPPYRHVLDTGECESRPSVVTIRDVARTVWIWLLVCTSLAVAGGGDQTPAPAAASEAAMAGRISTAVSRGVAWLRKKQKANGSFGPTAGETALCLLALRHSGVLADDPSCVKTEKYLRRALPRRHRVRRRARHPRADGTTA